MFVELASVTYYQIEITHLDSEITVEPDTVVHTLHTFQYFSVCGNLREILYAFYNQHFFAFILNSRRLLPFSYKCFWWRVIRVKYEANPLQVYFWNLEVFSYLKAIKCIHHLYLYAHSFTEI